MTFALTPEEEKLAARPHLASAAGPVRHSGGSFRGADGAASRTAAEDAVTAAVRMAYRVADAQLQRSAKLAERLNRAGDGSGVARAAGTAGGFEPLKLRMVVEKMAWLEGIAAESEGPLQRMIAAQRELLSALLGVAPPVAGRASKTAGEAREAAPTAMPKARIFLKGEERRAVTLARCDIASGALSEVPVAFYQVHAAGAGRLDGAFSREAEGEAVLTVATSLSAPAGRWRAAVCRKDGEQIGVIEIEL